MRKMSVIVFTLLVIWFASGVSMNTVFAEGGWISGDVDTGSGGGGGGGGAADEMTWSWIYYKSLTNDKLTNGLSNCGSSNGSTSKCFPFVPDNWYINNGYSGAGNFYISADCSGKTEDGTSRGFWHLGTNAAMTDAWGVANKCGIYSFSMTGDGKTPGWPSYAINAGTGWACQLTRSGFNYSGTVPGAYGHSSTRDLETMGPWTTWGWGEQAKTNVNHDLYYNNTKIFTATESRTSAGVLDDFAKAYKAATGSDYEKKKGMPTNVYSFCYWKGMDETKTFKLTAYAVDGTTGNLLNSGNSIASDTKKEGEDATVAATTINNYYVFGYRTTQSSGAITSGNKYTEKGIKADKTVYFVYYPKYKLSISHDGYSSATVNRTESPYAGAKKGVLSDGDVIYYGDKLSVSFSYKGCLSTGYDYVKNSESISGSDVSGNNVVVKSNISVAVTSKDQSRTITVKSLNTDGDTISGMNDVTKRVCYDKNVSIDRLKNPTGYTFVGWKNSTSGSYLTNVTKPSSGYYLSESSDANVLRTNSTSPSSDRAYGRYNYVKLTSNITRYAIYVATYRYTGKTDAHSSMKVYRTTSPNAHAPSSSSSEILSVGNSGNKSVTVYKGDALSVNASPSDCWYIKSLTIVDGGGTSVSGGIGTTTVASKNITGESISSIYSYTLNVSRAGGSKIVVNRAQAASGSGASTGDLYNKNGATGDTASATIYCGDVLKTDFSLMTGYSWGSHSFVGHNINNTSDLSISSHIVRNNVTVKTENVIRNKFSAQASVAEGTNWNEATERELTGYYPHASGSKTSTSIDINCKNAGCQTNFWLQLKRDAGTGSTNYRIKSSTNGVSSAWLPASPSALTASSFPDSGSTLLVLGASNIIGEQIGLVPGGSFCRYIAFKPYGNYANDTYETVFACANAKVTYFEGLSKVKDSTSTGWTSTTKSVRHVIQDCLPTAGCDVVLQHALRRSNSVGSTDYNVSRRSNLWVSSKSLGVESKSSIGSGTFGEDNARIVVTDSVKLYPGMVVCEALTFKPNNNQVTVASNISTTVCVSAEGDGQPPDPNDPDPGDPEDPNPEDPNPDDSDGDSESGAYLKMEVKNNDNSKYSTYRRIVYAKPNDNLTYRAVYNPILQYTYYLVPERMQINGTPSTPLTNNSGLTLGGLFNANRGSRMPWNNAFNVSSASFVSNVSFNYDDYTNGDTSRQRETNDHSVQVTEVGRILTETATINQNNNSTVHTTPSQITFRDVSNANLGNVITNRITSTAYARIPYNFNTKVEVTTPEDKIMYAGEDSSVGYDIEILKKTNRVTGDGTEGTSYATIVRDAKWRVINYTTTGSPRSGVGSWGNVDSDLCGYYGGGVSNCGYSTVENGKTLNSSGKMAGDLTSYSSSFNVPDLDAGTRICVAVAVYPSSSGSDINLSSSGSGTWRISDSKCYLIAKKPSFQLWGGGMYIAGDADVPVSAKNNLAGYPEYSYQHTGKNGYNVFGSWVETGLVAGGSVSGLASGAGTAYDANNNGDLIANPGGSREESTKPLYCKRSTLSIANDYCGSSYVGNIGGSTLQASMSDKSALVQRLLPDGFSMTTNTTAERVNISSDYTETDSGLRYTYSADDLIIDGATLENGVTHIVRSDKNITIDGNLLYQDSNYVALNEIPKLIIYGDNITISCKSDDAAIVRIDAVLIANHTVDTCETTDANSRENSYQLKINGLIIADTLKLNRTYGAGKGVYSIIPAEIINYDTTLYLWSMVDSPNATGTGKYSESYLRELSPRY